MTKGRVALVFLLTCLFSGGMMVADDFAARSRRSFIAHAEPCQTLTNADGNHVKCPNFERSIHFNGLTFRGDVHTLSERSLHVCEWFEDTVWTSKGFVSLGMGMVPICWVVGTAKH